MDIFYNIISIFFLIFVCLIPVVLWGYFFSFHSEKSSRKTFFYGILSGGVSTIPILGMEHIFTNIFPALNIFKHLHGLADFQSYLLLMLSLFIVIGGISIFFFILRGIFSNKKEIEVLKYLKATGMYTAGIFFLGVLFFLFSFLVGNALVIEGAPTFMGYIFNSLKLVILYYFVIAFLEEGTKYFAFLSGVNFSELSGKKGILFVLYIALGFAFFENILYAFYIFGNEGLSFSLVSIILYRSIFSLFIHVLSSIILGFAVSKMFAMGKTGVIHGMSYVIIGMFGAILIHASFDILITLGWTSFIFLYFIGGYGYVSKLIFSDT